MRTKESAHPIFNSLQRRFGKTRGRKFKLQVMRQFLFERSSFIRSGIDEMIHATQKSKREKKVIMKKEEKVKPEFEDGKPKFEDEDVAWDYVLPDSASEYPTGTLDEMEIQMNGSEALHPFDGIGDNKDGAIDDEMKKFNTKIASCLECGKRLLGLAREIHR